MMGSEHRVVLHCCTVYQLIVAIQIKLTQYKEEWSELIISESTPDSQRLGDRIREAGIFDSVIVADNESTDWNAPQMVVWYNIRRKIGTVLSASAIKKDDVIDEFLFAGLGGFSNAIGQWLMHEHHCKNLSLFEEGASSYSRIYSEAINMRKNNPSILKKIYYFFNPHILSRIKKIYLFEPELLTWNVQSKVIKIPKLLDTESSILPILNKVYDIESCEDSYNEKVIFFEESYNNDGIQTNDVELVERLAKIYGKENVFIKTHPRNRTNRFKELGYLTNHDSSIPWEVIALNLKDLDDKILVTMTSTALITTFLCIGSKAQIIFSLGSLNSDNQRVKYTAEVIRRLMELYPNSIKESV